MQDYARYDIKDFLADEAFCRWVLHQKPADKAFWEKWVRNNPDRADIVTAAKALISEIHHAQDYLSDEEMQQELQRLSSARKSATEELAYTEPSRNGFGQNWFGRNNLRRISQVCGVLACLVLLFYIYKNAPTGQSQVSRETWKGDKNEQWIEVANSQSNTKYITLPDGSSV